MGNNVAIQIMKADKTVVWVFFSDTWTQ